MPDVWGIVIVPSGFPAFRKTYQGSDKATDADLIEMKNAVMIAHLGLHELNPDVIESFINEELAESVKIWHKKNIGPFTLKIDKNVAPGLKK